MARFDAALCAYNNVYRAISQVFFQTNKKINKYVLHTSAPDRQLHQIP